jgi:hypothetical protein
MRTEFFYKIRRKSDGLFSTGGSSPRFTKTGKSWSNRGNLDRHLGMLLQNRNIGALPAYKDCEVITFITEVTDYEPVEKFISVVAERKQMKEEEYERRIEKRREENRRKQYEMLKQEFDN